MIRASTVFLVVTMMTFIAMTHADPTPLYCQSVNCTCLNMAVMSDSAVSQRGAAYDDTLIFTAQTQYRACEGMNFNAFLKYNWTLLEGAKDVLGPKGISTNGSTLVLPPKFLTPDVVYNVSLTVRGANDDEWTWEGTVEVAMPAVVLRVGKGESSIRVGTGTLFIPASVTVPYGPVEKARWECIAECPESVVKAFENGTNTGLTIPGPIPVRSYLVRLYYGDVFASLYVEVGTGEVPVIAIHPATPPLAPPLKFLQDVTRDVLTFRASYTSTAPITARKWTLNWVPLAETGDVVHLNYTQLTRTSNMLSLMVNTSTSYGESAVTFEFTKAPTLSVTSVENADRQGATSAAALKERIRLTVALSESTMLGVPVTYVVKFEDTRNNKTVRAALPPPAVSKGTLTFTAPMPWTTEEKVETLFIVEAMFGSVVAATASKSFEVTVGSRTEAADSLKGQLDVVQDPAATLNVLANLGALLATDAGLKEEMAKVAVKHMKAIADVVAALDDSQRGQLVDSLASAVNNETANDAVDLLIRVKVPVDKVEAGISVIASATAQGGSGPKAVEATNAVAASLLEATPVGETKTVSAGNVSVTTAQVVLDATTPVTVSSASSSVQLPAGGLAGLPAGSVGGIIASEFASDPLGTGVALKSKVFSFVVAANGEVVAVSGLKTGILIEMEAQDPSGSQCEYYDTNTNKMSTAGVVTEGFTGTTLKCRTSHLTSFAATVKTGGSSAVSVVASTVTLLVVTLLTLTFSM